MAPIWKKRNDKDDDDDVDDGDTPSCLAPAADGICQALVQDLLAGREREREIENQGAGWAGQSKSMRNDLGVARAKELVTLG